MAAMMAALYNPNSIHYLGQHFRNNRGNINFNRIPNNHYVTEQLTRNGRNLRIKYLPIFRQGMSVSNLLDFVNSRGFFPSGIHSIVNQNNQPYQPPYVPGAGNISKKNKIISRITAINNGDARFHISNNELNPNSIMNLVLFTNFNTGRTDNIAKISYKMRMTRASRSITPRYIELFGNTRDERIAYLVKYLRSLRETELKEISRIQVGSLDVSQNTKTRLEKRRNMNPRLPRPQAELMKNSKHRNQSRLILAKRFINKTRASVARRRANELARHVKVTQILPKRFINKTRASIARRRANNLASAMAALTVQQPRRARPTTGASSVGHRGRGNRSVASQTARRERTASTPINRTAQRQQLFRRLARERARLPSNGRRTTMNTTPG